MASSDQSKVKELICLIIFKIISSTRFTKKRQVCKSTYTYRMSIHEAEIETTSDLIKEKVILRKSISPQITHLTHFKAFPKQSLRVDFK